jgi:hypothetical protein
MLCQLALLFHTLNKGRVFIRTASFCASLFLFFALRRATKSHPSSRYAVVALVVIAASIPRPESDSVWAGVACVFLHLAVLAPIFWVPRITIDIKTVRQVFLLFWLFNTASALAGALQVYFPGQFQPGLASTFDEKAAETLQITLSSGLSVPRPMGLTDTPGGAAIASFYCVLLGIGFFMETSRWWFKGVLLISMALGLFTLYLCEVRSLVVMLVISTVAMGLPLLGQRRPGRFVAVLAVVLAIGTLGFGLATSVAEQHVTNRFASLFASDPGTVYAENRGIFIRYTIYDLIPTYPLGAGLGRWGMIHSYFADPSHRSFAPLWAEIQWSGWVYDGGVPLMVAYAAAVLTALLCAFRIATRPDSVGGDLQKWGTVLFGYGVAALAMTFNAPIFESNSGLDFWLLNATVFAASQQLAGGGRQGPAGMLRTS